MSEKTHTQLGKEALKRASHAVVRPYYRVALMVYPNPDGSDFPKTIWASQDSNVVRLMERFIKKKFDFWKDVGTSRTWLYAHMVAMPDDYYVRCFATTWSKIWRDRMMEDTLLFNAENYKASRLKIED